MKLKNGITTIYQLLLFFFFLMVAPLADDLPLTPHHEGIYHFPLSLSQSFGKTNVDIHTFILFMVNATCSINKLTCKT